MSRTNVKCFEETKQETTINSVSRMQLELVMMKCKHCSNYISMFTVERTLQHSILLRLLQPSPELSKPERIMLQF